MIIFTQIIHTVPCTRKSLKKTNTDVSTDGLHMRSSMERLEWLNQGSWIPLEIWQHFSLPFRVDYSFRFFEDCAWQCASLASFIQEPVSGLISLRQCIGYILGSRNPLQHIDFSSFEGISNSCDCQSETVVLPQVQGRNGGVESMRIHGENKRKLGSWRIHLVQWISHVTRPVGRLSRKEYFRPDGQKRHLFLLGTMPVDNMVYFWRWKENTRHVSCLSVRWAARACIRKCKVNQLISFRFIWRWNLVCDNGLEVSKFLQSSISFREMLHLQVSRPLLEKAWQIGCRRENAVPEPIQMTCQGLEHLEFIESAQ